ncbi:MAG: cation transporter [Chloroflexota bacterium]|nr:cation transporter [Chloroflexota bacterium]
MSTRQISFAIQGMREACPKCAVDIEHALTQLDGVVAAQVNYATERATVVYDPIRVLPATLVNAIRSRGYEVPLVRVTLYADDLLYATSAQTIEKVLGRTEGMVSVSVDFASRSVVLEMLPDPGHLGELTRRTEFERALARLGFSTIPSPTPAAVRKFVLRTLFITGLALLVVASAGAHVGLYTTAGLFHSPLVIMAVSALVLLGAGLPFYVFAYDAASQGVFDTSVAMALLAIVSAFASLPLGMISPTLWLTSAGFVVTSTLTAGWFLVRAIQIWGLHREAAVKEQDVTTARQTQLGAISDGSRR